jgi:phytoene desaturase
MSLYVLYFGTNKKYPGILHHNVMFGPRYKELLTDIFDRGVIADDFSLYLHAPSVSDPSMAPEGGECFYVLSPVPHLGHGRKDPQKAFDWKNHGSAYGDRIIDYLEKHAMPGLRKSIVVREERTPLDFETTLDSYLGAAFSLEPILTQSAFFRVHNRDDRLKGLYFAGAGTHPGAGIPGVVGSAQATASVIFADYSNSENQKKGATSPELRTPVAGQFTQASL